MYEQIPMYFVLNAIYNRWNEIEELTQMLKNLFMRIVRFCIKDNNYLKFNSKFYRANNGLAIGGSASPILADMVMTDILLSAVAERGYPIFLK